MLELSQNEKKGGETMLNIRKLRKEKELKQVDLAKMVGIKNNTLSQYETGERMPNIEMLTKLAKVLNCSIDELIKDEEKEK